MPNEITIQLKRKARESLERKRRKSLDVHVVRRATIILMSDDGNEVGEICAVVGVCRATVTNTRRRWLALGLEGLADKPRPGRTPTADGEYMVALMFLVGTPPSKFGYAFSVWTSARLAAHLAKKTGKRLSAGTVASLLRSAGYCWRRPKHTLLGRRDEAAHADAKERLARLEKPRGVRTQASRSSSSTKRASIFTPTSRAAGDDAAPRSASRRPGRIARSAFAAPTILEPDSSSPRWHTV